jgi:N,N'-diacetyllegionaminate synthase
MKTAPTSFDIGSRTVGSGGPCLIIGEVAQAHDGSLGQAHAFIDVIAESGAHAVKFQTHIADAESTSAEQFRVQFAPQDATRYDYWRRMEFAEEQWHGLAQHARDKGLLFLSSPFSVRAIELLERVGVPAWKLGSGETTNFELLDRMTATGKPVLISSGMSNWSELDTTVKRAVSAGSAVAVLQCTTAYPVPPERVGLNIVTELAERYGCPVGLSDHSGTIFPALAAVTLGASLVEVHVTLSRHMFGPDVAASLTPSELRQLADGVAFIQTALAVPVDKDAVASGLTDTKLLFGRSVALRDSLPAGTTLTPAHLTLKKPGSGIPPARLPDLVGKVLRHGVAADELLKEDDVQ